MFDADAEGWMIMPFSKAVEIAPRRPLPRNGKVPFLDMASLPLNGSPVVVTEEREVASGGARFRAGDTLFARITPCTENGKLGFVQSIVGDAVAQGSTEFIVMAAREGTTLPEYVRFLAGWSEVRDQAISLMEGTSGRQRVPAWAFDEIEVPVPPLDEQRRIAEVLRSVDEAIAATEMVLRATSTVRQSALDALMRSLAETDGHAHVLSEVAEVRTGIAKNKNANGRHIQMPYLRVANVQDGWFDLSDTQEIMIEADKVERYSLKDGDVLLTEGGDYDKLGRGGVWKAQVHPCLHQNHVFCVRSDQARLLPEFLALVTQSCLGRAYFLACAKRTTNLASINSSQLRALPVPLPDLERQRAIIAEVGCIDVLIEREEEKLKSLQRLRTSHRTDLLSGRVRVPA
jgi:type I restriction enzyme S subunit